MLSCDNALQPPRPRTSCSTHPWGRERQHWSAVCAQSFICVCRRSAKRKPALLMLLSAQRQRVLLGGNPVHQNKLPQNCDNTATCSVLTSHPESAANMVSSLAVGSGSHRGYLQTGDCVQKKPAPTSCVSGNQNVLSSEHSIAQQRGPGRDGPTKFKPR